MAYGFSVINSQGRSVGSLMIGHLDRSYRLANGTIIPVFDGIAWCGNCRHFVEAERLKALEDIDGEIARVLAGDTGQRRATASIAKLMGEEFLAQDPDRPERTRKLEQQELEEWLAIRAWRLSRRVRARCLRCGSMDIQPIPDDQTAVTRPDTGETFRIECIGHFSLVNHDYFTPEGLPAPADAM